MFAGMLLLMVVRVPIAAAMFIPGALGYWAMTSEAALLNQIKGSSVARLTVYDLSVIPLFLLMGQFATQGGLSRALFRAAAAFVGHIRGGLAMASVLAAGAFGAVCGSSVATSATITQVAYPQMKAHGYHGRLSTATLAAGGTLGILIPPSVPLVVYAILTEQNIAKLFAAAMVPGLIAMLGYIAVVGLVARRKPDLAPPLAPLAWSERWRALVAIWPIVAIFLLVFGGIYTGLFSPTEGAAVGAVATFVAGLAQRELNWRGIRTSFLGTAETSAMVFMIFLGADMINASLALTAMPAAVADWVGHLPVAPLAIVGAVLVLYVILGGVMDELSMMLLTIPVIFPAIMQLPLLGLDPEPKAIWFGILVLMTVSFGLIAPPVGLNVYVVNGIAKDVPMNETYKGVLPFLAWDVLRMVLLLLFPAISLGLVRLLFK
jgi:tripartite ATP-independent transporter DctM subunit